MKNGVRDLGHLFSSSKASFSLKPDFKYMEIKLKLLTKDFPLLIHIIFNHYS